jgi:hypothetical protein
MASEPIIVTDDQISMLGNAAIGNIGPDRHFSIAELSHKPFTFFRRCVIPVNNETMLMSKDPRRIYDLMCLAVGESVRHGPSESDFHGEWKEGYVYGGENPLLSPGPTQRSLFSRFDNGPTL